MVEGNEIGGGAGINESFERLVAKENSFEQVRLR